jgi:hypothetical protein
MTCTGRTRLRMAAVRPEIWNQVHIRGQNPVAGPARTGRRPGRFGRERGSALRTVALRSCQTLPTGSTATVRPRE